MASTLFLVSIFSISILTASAATISIPLSSFSSSSAAAAPPLHEILSHLASTSLSRALRLKQQSPPPSSDSSSSSSLVTTPLFPRSYGGYSISLSFGTPPQTTKFVMDTGSTLVWFPCTSRYLCSRCNFRNVDSTNITTFIPKKSSTAKIVGCKSKKCEWIYGPDVAKTCSGCDSAKSTPNCTQTCPPYSIQYGSGATTGLLLSETLDLSREKKVPDFLVGCSVLSIRQPEGIAGFGRGLDSLPSQVGAKRFSYCLVSHRFDETSVSSDLVLDLDSNSNSKKMKRTVGMSYTSFQKNPDSSNSAFQTYYYLMLRQILVGGKRVKVPYQYLSPSKSDGNGGTIVDSGTTFSYMEGPIYEAVTAAIVKEMSNYTVAKDVQDLTGLRPCFDVSRQDKLTVPQLSFKFKGGAEMQLPVTNYFVLVGDGVICFTVVSDSVVGKGARGGPSIILGNYQQRDYNIEYDLENERFGFKKQKCA
ncbi:Aspartic proteinase nepenthesin-2 [Linum perenne]